MSEPSPVSHITPSEMLPFLTIIIQMECDVHTRVEDCWSITEEFFYPLHHTAVSVTGVFPTFVTLCSLQIMSLLLTIMAQFVTLFKKQHVLSCWTLPAWNSLPLTVHEVVVLCKEIVTLKWYVYKVHNCCRIIIYKVQRYLVIICRFAQMIWSCHCSFREVAAVQDHPEHGLSLTSTVWSP